MPRCFLAIPIKNHLEKIIELQKKFKPFGNMLKFVEPHNLHLTLKFLGEIDFETIEKIKTILTPVMDNYKPFEIFLKGLGVFPNKNFIRVLWIGIENPQQLISLMKSVDQKLSDLGFQKEKSYIPHLTIARVKKRPNEHFVKLIDELVNIEIGKILVKDIIFYQSKLYSSGPVCTELFRWQL